MNINEVNEIKMEVSNNFPKLIAAYKEYGITKFQTCASTAKTMYFNNEDETVYDEIDYFNLPIGELNIEKFKVDLIDHQKGITDFPQWLELTAGSGIAYWIVDLNLMTCIYYDQDDNQVHTELINI